MTPRTLALFTAAAFFPTTLAVARELIWAGEAGDALTAGSGSWDENTSATWRDATPKGLLVRWSQHATAVFRGTGGGEVRLLGSVATDGLVFSASAGAFTLRAAGELTISGDGIRCASAADQTLNIRGAILRFTDRASAAEGPESEHLHIVSDSLVNFTETSTAGRAQVESSGELYFAGTSSAARAQIVSTGNLVFTDRATLDRAVITSDGLLSLADEVSSQAAAITNRGLFSCHGAGLHLDALAISNNENGLLDLSNCTGALRIASLTNAADAALHLGAGALRVDHLHLVAGNTLAFHLGAAGVGSIEVTTALVGSLAFGGTAISIVDTGIPSAARTYTLLDWSAATVVLGIEPGHFVLQELPAGHRGTLRVADRKLLLDLQPAAPGPGE